MSFSKRIVVLGSLALLNFLQPLFAEERIDLEAAAIIGSQDLPQVLYIVPWKESAMDNMVVKPGMTLDDQLLKPLDRTVFKRQIEHYNSLESE